MKVAAIDVLFAAMPLTFTGKIKKQGFARKPALLRGTESRQKTVGMSLFCLPSGPNSGREDLKVEQNLQKLKKYSTAASKIGPCDIESRTKSQKIGKMFYRRLQIRSARFRK